MLRASAEANGRSSVQSIPCQQFQLDDDSDDPEEVIPPAREVAGRKLGPDDAAGGTAGPGVARAAAPATAADNAGQRQSTVLRADSLKPPRLAEAEEWWDDEALDATDYGSWLRKVYATHKPDNLAQVPAILEKFKGREDELSAAICQKYNICLPAALSKQLSNGSKGSGSGRPKAGAPEKPGTAGQPDYGELIRGVYEQVKPEKLRDVPTLLAKYKGKEGALYLQICEKYGVRPVAAAVAAAPAPPRQSPVVRASLLQPRGRAAQQAAQRQGPAPEELQRQLQEALGEVERLREERDGALDGVTQIQEVLSEANRRLALRKDENSAAHEEIAQLRKRLAAAEAEGAAGPADQSAGRDSEETISALRRCLDEATQERDTATEAAGRQAAELRTSLDNLRAEGAEAQRRAGDAATAQREAADLAAELQRLRTAAAEDSGLASAEEEEVRRLREAHFREAERATEARTSAAASAAEAERLEAAVAEMAEQLRRGVAGAGDAGGDLDQLRAEVVAARSEAEDGCAASARAEAEVRRCEEDAVAAREEVSSLRSRLEQLGPGAAPTAEAPAAGAEDEAPAVRARQEARELSEELERLRARSTEEAEAAKAETAPLRRESAELAAEVQRLREVGAAEAEEEVRRRRESTKTSQQAIASLMSELEQLRGAASQGDPAALATAREEVAELQTGLEEAERCVQVALEEAAEEYHAAQRLQREVVGLQERGANSCGEAADAARSGALAATGLAVASEQETSELREALEQSRREASELALQLQQAQQATTTPAAVPAQLEPGPGDQTVGAISGATSSAAAGGSSGEVPGSEDGPVGGGTSAPDPAAQNQAVDEEEEEDLLGGSTVAPAPAAQGEPDEGEEDLL